MWRRRFPEVTFRITAGVGKVAATVSATIQRTYSGRYLSGLDEQNSAGQDCKKCQDDVRWCSTSAIESDKGRLFVIDDDSDSDLGQKGMLSFAHYLPRCVIFGASWSLCVQLAVFGGGKKGCPEQWRITPIVLRLAREGRWCCSVRVWSTGTLHHSHNVRIFHILYFHAYTVPRAPAALVSFFLYRLAAVRAAA